VHDDTKAVSRSPTDRLCRRRDVPLREKTLSRMLYYSASRASAVLALNVEDLDQPNKQAKITAKGGDRPGPGQRSRRSSFLINQV
jgi:integrase